MDIFNPKSALKKAVPRIGPMYVTSPTLASVFAKPLLFLRFSFALALFAYCCSLDTTGTANDHVRARSRTFNLCAPRRST